MKATRKAQLSLLGTLLGTALVILLLAVLAPESHAQSAWVVEVVDTASFLIDDTALALDAAGRPHGAYHAAAPSVVRYARKDGAAWQIETIDGSDGLDISLAIDPTGHPAIAYTGPQDYPRLIYARLAAGGWETETIDAAGGTARHDSKDHARIDT